MNYSREIFKTRLCSLDIGYYNWVLMINNKRKYISYTLICFSKLYFLKEMSVFLK